MFTSKIRFLFPSWKVIFLTALLVLSLVYTNQPVISSSLSNHMEASLGIHIDIGGPVGSGAFGTHVIALPNGNFVVADPMYDEGGVADIGAVYLFNGKTGTIIVSILGTHANDQVGKNVWMQSNGNYLIGSPLWDNGTFTDAGALTWCNGSTGCSGTVSAANSLLGSSNNDQVGDAKPTELANGKYVVNAIHWHNSGVADAGAVRLCSGDGSCTGTLTSDNSLVGSSVSDQVGTNVDTLSNSSYIVRSPSWSNTSATSAGAVTWCSSTTTGCIGVVSTDNSLVGSTADDQIGLNFTLLKNGNFIVHSFRWHSGSYVDVGEATWCSATSGCPTGVVSSSNSLVGSHQGDFIGRYILLLPNGDYVEYSPIWNNGSTMDAGEATWCDGTSGCTGTIDSSTSLIGSSIMDDVGWQVVALSNSSYVVISPYWNNPTGPITTVGAVTWCSSSSPCTGTINSTNSTVGRKTGDQVGSGGAYPLSSGGKYVISSPLWDSDTATDVGAVTLCNSTFFCTGPVVPSTSLIGVQVNDKISLARVTPLSSGNYVVGSFCWDNGTATDAGAVTFCDGINGCKNQTVNSANSLVGTRANDTVGWGGIFDLQQGYFVAASPGWSNEDSHPSAGAVTWCSSTTGCPIGTISSANSLIGSGAGDFVGEKIIPLSNGNYVVSSPYWSIDKGAATWCSGTAGCVGEVSPTNSLVGSSNVDLIGAPVTYDEKSIFELQTGNYIIFSIYWMNGANAGAGAVTMCNGTTSVGCIGPISAANSLLGSSSLDHIGYNNDSHEFEFKLLNNGYYIISSPFWDYAPWLTNSGAVSLGDGNTPTFTGPISLANSVIGTVNNGGATLVYDFDDVHSQLVVGRPLDNVVSLFRIPYAVVYLPAILR